MALAMMKKVLLLVVAIFVSFVLYLQLKDKLSATTYDWGLEKGLPKPYVPADNPMTKEKVRLGRFLFYDKALSGNSSQSCASCHVQGNAFAEERVVSIGSTGDMHRRNSPGLINIAYNKTLTWAHDGLTDIELQVLLPMFGEEPIELGITGHEELVLSRLKRETYPELFEQAFDSSIEDIGFLHVTQALASFVRSLISLNSPFDAYAYSAEDGALNEHELAGMELFFSERLECHHCHGGFNFTQSTTHEKQPLDRRPFHNTGLYYTERFGMAQVEHLMGYPLIDRGLAEISGNPNDDGRFRAPSLRNIALTAPYMHDGSVATLAEVVDIYAAGGRNVTSGEHIGDGRLNPLKSPFVKGFTLSEAEKAQLLAFLNSLTDTSFISNPAFSDPWVEVPNTD